MEKSKMYVGIVMRIKDEMVELALLGKGLTTKIKLPDQFDIEDICITGSKWAVKEENGVFSFASKEDSYE